jgi:hypothetical protein
MAIRRKDATVKTTSMHHVRLYRDELEGIAKALSEFGELAITYDAYEATAAEDFTELPETGRDVKMTAKSGESSVTVTLSPRSARIVEVEPTSATHGLASLIRSIAGRGSRVPLRAWLGLTPVVIPTLLAITYAPSLGANWSVIVVLFTMLITMIVLRRIPARMTGESARVINAYRADRPTFLQRTRDDWVVELVCVAIGLVAGYILGRLTGG